MKTKGQVIVVVAIFILAGMFLLALLVDGGRLYLRRNQAQRAAQSAADAGMGEVADRMVTLAVPRQTEAAALVPCIPDGEFGDDGVRCTATPEPAAISNWLEDEDRRELIQPEVRATVHFLVGEYVSHNGFPINHPSVLELRAQYPYQYDLEAETIRIGVLIIWREPVLLAGLLNKQFVDLPVEAISELPQR